MEISTLGVLGAGTMGTGIAQVAAQAGIRVFLLDPLEGAAERSRQLLEASLQAGMERHKLTAEQATSIPELITWEPTYESLPQADWVLEAVFEDRGVKEQALRQACQRMRDGVPLATNTSTFRVQELAAFTDRPQFFLGLHFFNPVPAMKLVEVIPGEETLPEVTEAAVALGERMGKTPQIAPDIPGFMVNRALGALIAAALDIWSRGGDPEVIDGSIELGLGHRMGPLRTADLIGLDVLLALLRSLHDQTGHPRFEPPEPFVKLVESGKLGRKSGEGFYRYPPPESRP